MVQFMDQSYRKFGGQDSVGYNKYLRKNVEELKNQKIYSEIELARNAFNPDNSKYLSPDEHKVASSLLEDKLINSRYIVESTSRSVNLSQKIHSFVESQKLRKSRNEALGDTVHNIVSYLESNDIDPGKLADVSTMLLEDITMDQLEDIKKKKVLEKNKIDKKDAKKTKEKPKNNKSKETKDKVIDKGKKVAKKTKDKKEKDKKPSRSKSKKKESTVKDKKSKSRGKTKDKKKKASSKAPKKKRR